MATSTPRSAGLGSARATGTHESAVSPSAQLARGHIAASALLVAILIAGLIVAISNQLGDFGGNGLRDGEVRTAAATQGAYDYSPVETTRFASES